MPQGAWFADDFQGLTPAIDPRRVEKVFTLNGRNYVWDSIGPKSTFGNRWLTPYPLGRPEHIQGFRVKLRGGDRVFVMTGDSILEWSEADGAWNLIYITPLTTPQPYRWTIGYLNGFIFFCHPVTGILVLPLAGGIVQPLIGPGVPEQPIALVVNNGRLCVINDTHFMWSNPSDGLDWTPKVGGAGFQLISNHVAGDPIMLTSYTAGTLTWTTGGVLRSEFTGDSQVYRHRPLNTEYRPLNSFCTMKVDDNTVVIVDERGLFQSKGEAPTPFAPLFNEFLIQYFQDFDLRLGTNVRIEWDELQRQVYLSVSPSYQNPIYEKTFVYYPPMDKWGQFSERHYGILPMRIDGTERGDDYFGFVDDTKRLRLWQKVGSVETLPVDTTLDSRYSVMQKPPHLEDADAGVILSSSFVVNSVPMLSTPRPSGYFPRDGEVPARPELAPLNALIQLGLLRFANSESVDQMTEITQLAIGSSITGEPERNGIDYNLVPPDTEDEDYNEETGGEDFGLDPLNYVNHKLRVISTLDGVTTYMESIPELVDFRRGIRYFSCTTNGVWHIVELSATEVGEAFRLRFLGLTAVESGVFS